MLKKGERLRAKKDFKTTYNFGTSYVHPLLVLYVFPNGKEVNRLGLSVSKRVGNAVKRNRIKRLLREGYRGIRDNVSTGYDFILIARPRIKTATTVQIGKAMYGVFRKGKLFIREKGSPS